MHRCLAVPTVLLPVLCRVVSRQLTHFGARIADHCRCKHAHQSLSLGLHNFGSTFVQVALIRNRIETPNLRYWNIFNKNRRLSCGTDFALGVLSVEDVSRVGDPVIGRGQGKH